MWGLGFGILGLGCGVWDLGFGVQGFRGLGLTCWLRRKGEPSPPAHHLGSGFRDKVSGFRVWGLRSGV